MIHINVDGKTPDALWLKRADSVTAMLMQSGLSDAKRRKLIDDNDQIWRDLAPWLKDLSHDKCWYSEARDCAAYWHVDHFRPKGEVKDLEGNSYEGYWWLAFNWKNYRLVGAAMNVPKSSKFPVRENTDWACGPDDDIDDESPYLLDPTCPEDPCLLSFDEQGKAIAAEPQYGWHNERADVSIKILNLNFDSLKRGRKRVWHSCRYQALEVLSCKDSIKRADSGSKKQKLRDGVAALKAMVNCEAEFSSVAAVCIMAQGDRWLERTVLFN